MALVVAKSIFCDKCGQWVYQDVGMNAAALRTRARRELGWSYLHCKEKSDAFDKKQDLCPDCNGSVNEQNRYSHPWYAYKLANASRS